MLIRLPESWPHSVVAALAMLVLATLDLAGAFAAKEAVLRRSVPMAVGGVALFVLLFWVYASSLRYADLAPVTFGWIVILQVGVVVLDRYHYGAQVSRGQWAAVGVLLAAQAYLILAPAQASSSPSVSRQALAPASEPTSLARPMPVDYFQSAEGRYSSTALP
jgi:hypothetical protein